ncbi:MAG: hypothetical protein IJ306_10000 [Oscillospiraceae bacterium]|nr:hypothetical protein [Oscillospiraceae bacterium]
MSHGLPQRLAALRNDGRMISAPAVNPAKLQWALRVPWFWNVEDDVPYNEMANQYSRAVAVN